MDKLKLIAREEHHKRRRIDEIVLGRRIITGWQDIAESSEEPINGNREKYRAYKIVIGYHDVWLEKCWDGWEDHELLEFLKYYEFKKGVGKWTQDELNEWLRLLNDDTITEEELTCRLLNLFEGGEWRYDLLDKSRAFVYYDASSPDSQWIFDLEEEYRGHFREWDCYFVDEFDAPEGEMFKLHTYGSNYDVENQLRESARPFVPNGCEIEKVVVYGF